MNRMRKLLGKKILLAVVLAVFTGGLVRAQEVKDTLTLTLDKALEIALSENPTMRVADQEIQLKKEAKKEAYGGLFPEVALSGSYSRTLKKQTMVMDFAGEAQTIQVGSDNSYSGGLTVNLPIFAPALYKSINLTKADVDLAMEKARSSKLDLINQVTKAYYQLLLAQDSYEVMLQSYNQAEINFEVVSAKYAQGTVSEYDKIRADVQVRSLKPGVVSARNGINLARLQLQVLMGMNTDIPVAVEGNLLNSTCKCNRILINNLFKFFVWREVSKSFTRSIIEFIFNPLNLFVGYFTKVLTLWDILPDKPVGVFIGTTFP